MSSCNARARLLSHSLIHDGSYLCILAVCIPYRSPARYALRLGKQTRTNIQWPPVSGVQASDVRMDIQLF